MIYKEWMKYIRDDVKITEVIMPGTHNAGSYGMNVLARCQEDTLYKQFEHGVRHFCIRYCGDKKGQILLSHGPIKGRPLAEALQDMRRMIEENSSEFFLFDMREYYPQKIGPFTLTSPADDATVIDLIEKYLAPEKYAFTDYDSIGDVTLGDLRKSGKRFIIINYRNAYQPWCRECEHILPWSGELHAKKTEVFAKEVFSHFDNNSTNGVFWFQTQLTPELNLKGGYHTPKKLEKNLLAYYQDIISTIASNPAYLGKANVISGDFMTAGYFKCREIIKLNLIKNTVKEEMKEEFERKLNSK